MASGSARISAHPARPSVATEADLQILTAAPQVELEAYYGPASPTRLQASGKGTEATRS
ncbi:hypothetical protein OG530_02970 [Streptomyces decoyicus]|uniref:hypothetical protein n=1 Tax=Streptomyces decoyicus TaxID=249567 RepID=UPI002E198306